MRILLAVSHFGFLRNFEFAIRELARRGHVIHLTADRKETLGGERTVEALTADHPTITHGFSPNPKKREWYAYSLLLRRCIDYLRYLEPRYANSPKLRGRAESQVPVLLARLGRSGAFGAVGGRRALAAALRALERGVPVDRSITKLLEKQRPDLLLITPLLYFGSQQVEYVRAARELGIRTVLGVGSWDHLTTKGMIHEIPDWVMVWNEAQRDEAHDLHGVPRERVIVTGAQAYDHWFVQRPSTSREEFGRLVGLDLSRPMLLYLCSSPFITPNEVGFVTRWIEAVRSSADAAVRGAAILIRPHPQNAAQWDAFDPSGWPAVAVWPPKGANPVDSLARAVYFDSMYHSAAVTGINTSGQIESGVLGKPVFTVLVKEFAGTQEGTLHFRHLRDHAGGLLHVADDLAEHVRQLAAVLASGAEPNPKSRAFVQAFVRPRGLAVPAAAVFADEIERVARLGPVRPVPAAPWTRVCGRLLQPAAALARSMTSAGSDKSAANA